MKLFYFVTLFLSIGLFNSCGEKVVFKDQPKKSYSLKIQKHTKRDDNIYGTYLAGRVAHMRQDYDSAANYYIKSINLGTEGTDILNHVYLLLAAQGRIAESAIYAQKALQSGDKSHLILFVLMTEDVKQGLFDEALSRAKMIKDKPLQDNILPILEAWLYAGENKKDEAFSVLEKLKKEPSLLVIYHMHRGMLADYFGDVQSAGKDYDFIIKTENLPLSFRALQIIGNFYIRNGMKEKIIEKTQKYYEQNKQAPMLKDLVKNFKTSDEASLTKIIDTPQKGFAEAMFNIGTMFRGFQDEAAQLFTSLVLYLNPQFEVARISLADLYEQTGQYAKSVNEYMNIAKDSPTYYIAQLKAASNYTLLDQKEKALEILKELLKMYPSNEQIAFRLGELSRIMGKYDKAIDFYHQAIEEHSQQEKDIWPIYYALGIAYERHKQWDKAEDSLKKALNLSDRNPFVLNYLGYSWIERDMNYNEAIYMIFEAHRKNSTDGHIMDSLGWALYKMGKYGEAVKILERASEYLPSNAIIFDHLGDAYWQAGRKNEARFQWQHALKASEDKEEINPDEIKKKIDQGMSKAVPVPFNESLLVERLKLFRIAQ